MSDSKVLKGRELSALMQTSQYYIAGRFAALCWFVPVAGILFHHALEMFLKTELIKASDLSDAELEKWLRRRFGHNLIRLWMAVKNLRPSAELDRFDETVAKLNEFEGVRYPEIGKRSSVAFSHSRMDGPPFDMVDNESQPLNTVLISLEEVDDLMASLWRIFDWSLSPLKGLGHPPGPQLTQVVYGGNNKHQLYPPVYDWQIVPWDES